METELAGRPLPIFLLGIDSFCSAFVFKCALLHLTRSEGCPGTFTWIHPPICTRINSCPPKLSFTWRAGGSQCFKHLMPTVELF